MARSRRLNEHRFPSAPVLTLLVLLLSGCATVRRGGTYPEGVPGPALTAEQQARVDHSCFGGLPRKTIRDLGPTEYIFRQGYVLEFSSLARIPLWVCETVTPAQLGGPFHREGRFAPDPDLQGPRSESSDYTNSGYDRGHQAPAGDETRDRQENIESFYMSNIAPQTRTLNEGIWEKLEQDVRHWAGEYGQVYVFTGPVFFYSFTGEPVPSSLAHPVEVIGHDRVAVPTHFYKIVLAQDHSRGTAGEWRAIAFVLPNVDYHPPYRPEDYRTTISWIEAHIGVRFMPKITGMERSRLEGKVSTMWP